VVFNNGGGAIFSLLPQAQLPEFKDYWLTPTGLDIARIASLYGLRHHRVYDKTLFTGAIESALDNSGVDLIEVMIDREQSIARRKAYWKSVATIG
jgi:2-succinyl-5-enolpyruvyl-6-hydroxy-3-cyclohexene-1-carboxylate synthase